jgi:hypothetical protein
MKTTNPPKLFLFMDDYVIRARALPAFIVALPVSLTVLAWFWEQRLILSVLYALIVWCGGAILVSQLSRDWGRKKQDRLYSAWGGKPTTYLLRHRNSNNKVLLAQQHQKLEQLFLGIKLPTTDEERINPKSTDDIYESCISQLINKTRNHQEFPLVFEENCNYGFRRNLWGMKTIGIVLAVISLLSIIPIVWLKNVHNPAILVLLIISGLLDLILLLIWFFLITPDWVKIPAFAYAERLLEALDSLIP